MVARVRLTPLGGVGRFGRNCLCVEVEDGPAILIDCGVRFVADEHPGFDVGLPDLERIAALGDRLLGVVLTHGHEDHIGGLPYLDDVELPLFATPFTAKLIERRFLRHGLHKPAIDVIDVHGAPTRTLGPFTITWLAVSHSIPDATCVVVHTPAGTLVHSGDFRVDEDPVLGPPTDLDGLTRAGDEGVDVLLADSTGATLPGRNPGEKSVGAGLDEAIAGAHGACFVALFASHIQRVSLVAETCRAQKKRLVLLGAGVLDCVAAARDIGLLAIDDVLVAAGDARNYPRERLVYAVTGSQAEPGSALARLAENEHHEAALLPRDRVVFSARVIPGNERKVMLLGESLIERGVDIVEGRASPHVSGHGYAGDLELLLAATRPKAFVALHGNARNLLAHGDLAKKSGLAPGRVVDLRDGSTLVLDDSGALAHLPGVRALEPLAAYGEVEMFPQGALRSRARAGQAGVIVIARGEHAPQIVLRGVSPALSEDMERALAEGAVGALAVAGGEDEAGALKALARIFWRARRVPPEIILLPG
ncbi:MAG TPA: ribonuclease J [Myxococcota bacterium]